MASHHVPPPINHLVRRGDIGRCKSLSLSLSFIELQCALLMP